MNFLVLILLCIGLCSCATHEVADSSVSEVVDASTCRWKLKYMLIGDNSHDFVGFLASKSIQSEVRGTGQLRSIYIQHKDAKHADSIVESIYGVTKVFNLYHIEPNGTPREVVYNGSNLIDMTSHYFLGLYSIDPKVWKLSDPLIR